ncbi:MAG TPA: NAD-dependent epimerase/dehydratase family protein [Acidimicrobiales bacterium]|nr:NAD-dependent epimerase/dehydratase family protein [Acidimicrobiales bacterium]
MRIVVTGGAGFIGSAVAARLVADGHEVTVADLRPPGEGRDGDPSDHVPVRHVTGDLRSNDVLEEAVGPGTDAVAHLAAATSVLASVKDPVGVYRSNVELTQSLLERCRQIGAGRLAFASTNAVVGSAGEDTVIDENSPLRPLTPYGATKAAAESLICAYRSAYGVAGTSLRLTNVYGPGVWVKDGMVARLLRAARSGGGVSIYGDGRQVRDYVYLEDVVDAFVAALTGDLPPVLIVGSGHSVDVLELHRLAGEASGSDVAREHIEGPPGEMRAVVVDRSLARDSGLPDPVELHDGLVRTWKAWPAAGADGPRPPLTPTPPPARPTPPRR